jgi:steroid delta-isomerase-like uncharacterized protein
MADQIDHRFAREFLDRLYAAVNAHDPQAIAALCADDVVWVDPGAPCPLRGREAVARFHREVMFRAIPDARIELVEGPYLAHDGTGAAVRARISGNVTGPMEPPGFHPTGGRVEFETAEFWEFEGGLLARETVIFDMLALARQVGAAPRQGTIAERVGVCLQRVTARRSRRHRRR